MKSITIIGLAAVLFATGPLWAQQTPACYAENDGPGFADNTSMGGPNLLLAIQLVAIEDIDVTRIEFFTGEGTGLNTAGIWSHDFGNDIPDTDLGTGSWMMDTMNSWQGADLPNPISLVAGETYWIMWGPQNGSQSSVLEPQPDNGQIYRASFDGGNTWIGPFSQPTGHWKYRLFCGTPMGGPLFLRGDADGDGSVSGLVDGLFILSYQFIPGSPTPPCLDSADIDDDGAIAGLVDGVLLLSWQFVPGSPPIPAPGPMSCGEDPSADGLDCLVTPCP